LRKYKNEVLQQLKGATVQRHIVVIRSFYKWMDFMRYGVDITKGIKGAKVESTFKKESLSVEEALRLLKRVEYESKTLVGKRNLAIITLLIVTGLRTIEIERANIEDISHKNGQPILYIQGKGRDDKDDYVKLPPIVHDAITEYLESRDSTEEAIFLNHGKNHKGYRIKTRQIREIVKDHLVMIGLNDKKYSTHSLRHTAATLNLKAGGTMEETQQLLRHKNISTTLIYSHHLKREENPSEHRIANLLKEGEEKNE
jgi:site-specific recombinase XerD